MADDIMYAISLYTGERFRAGTDAKVHITLFSRDDTTGRLKLNQPLRNDFESGRNDIVDVTAKDIGDLTSIQVEHDNSGISPDWFLDKVKVAVSNNETGKVWEFPCYQWLSKNTQLSVILTPDEGSYINTNYEYTRDRNVKTPYLYKVHWEQFPTLTWITKVVLLATNIFAMFSPNAIVDALNNIAEKVGLKSPVGAKSVEDFAKCLKDKKENVPSYMDFDKNTDITVSEMAFGEYRLSGPNPATIRLAKKGDLTTMGFGLDGDKALLNLLEKKELFIVDYSSLAKFTPNTVPIIPKIPKYPLGSIALFQQENRSLNTLCIKIIGREGRSKLFYPDGPDGRVDFKWEIAKCVFQSNDADFHEALVHLGGTHLVSEIFMVATYRRIPTDHPVFKLLAPHFEGTAFINAVADKTLVNKGGLVDQLVSQNIEEIHVAVKKFNEDFTSNDMTFPERIKARQMDVENVPNLDYPYRDDGMLLWDAINKWVTAYIRVFYPDDKAVASDDVIRRWINELISENGGNIRWLAGGWTQADADGNVKYLGTGFQYTVDWLIKLITSVIFIGSVDHAALNFPQRSHMQFAPAFPLGTYAGEEVCFKDHPTKEDYLSMLPPLSLATVQAQVGQLLGGIYHTQLGHYDEQASRFRFLPFQYFKGIKGFRYDYLTLVQRASKQFRDDLGNVTATINQRNQSRHPYTMMLPDKIPQSVNI